MDKQHETRGIHEGVQKQDRTSCPHPESSRTELKNGNGFRCEDCGAIVHDTNKTQLSCVSPTNQAWPRYTVQPNGTNTKQTKWMVVCTTPQGVTTRFGKRLYGTEADAQAEADELNKGVSAATIESVSSSCSNDLQARIKAEQAAGKKAKQEAASRERKAWLDDLTAEAVALRDECHKLRELGEDIEIKRRTFKEMLERLRPRIGKVLHGFRHLHDGETVEGYRRASDWAEGTFGVTYEWIRRCMKPAAETPSIREGNLQKLLPEGDDRAEQEDPTADSLLPTIPEKQEDGVVNDDVTDDTAPKQAEAAEDADGHGEGKQTVTKLLADTTPSFAIAVSPADVASNDVDANVRIAMGWLRSWSKVVSADEYYDILHGIMNGIQDELRDKFNELPQQAVVTTQVAGESRESVALQ